MRHSVHLRTTLSEGQCTTVGSACRRELGSYRNIPDTTRSRLRRVTLRAQTHLARVAHCSAHARPPTCKPGTRVFRWSSATDKSLDMPAAFMSSVLERRSKVCRRNDCSDFRSRSSVSSGIVPRASRSSASRHGLDRSLVTLCELPEEFNLHAHGSQVLLTNAQSTLCATGADWHAGGARLTSPASHLEEKRHKKPSWHEETPMARV